MKKQGFKQVEIAKKLGLTKAAVNQYLSEKRGNEVKFNDKIKQYISNSSKRINTEADTIREIQYIINLAREERVVCQIHKNTVKNCNLCFESPLINLKKQ